MANVFQDISVRIRNNLKYSDREAFANRVDPDQTSQNMESDQGLHCLPYIIAIFKTYQEVVECTISIFRTSMISRNGVPILRVNTFFFLLIYSH